MRVSILLIATALYAIASAQPLPGPGLPVPGVPVPAPVPLPVPVVPPVPFMPPFLGGFFPRFPFFGGFPFGPFGGLLRPFGPFGPFGPFRPFGPFGKRSVDKQVRSMESNRTVCSYDQARSVVRCEGEQDLECSVEARLDEINGLTVRLPSLNMIQDVIRAQGKEVPAIRVLSRVTGTSTLVNPRTNKDVVLSLYSSPVVSEPGWLVKDEQCFRRVAGLVSRWGLEGLRFTLNRE